jgi:hypothetical protein
MPSWQIAFVAILGTTNLYWQPLAVCVFVTGLS